MEPNQLCRMTTAGKTGDNIPHRVSFNIVCFITEHMIKWLYGSTKQNQAAQEFIFKPTAVMTFKANPNQGNQVAQTGHSAVSPLTPQQVAVLLRTRFLSGGVLKVTHYLLQTNKKTDSITALPEHKKVTRVATSSLKL